MIAVDTNILVYAHREDSPFYFPAKQALAGLMEGKRVWYIPWPCLYEFYSIVTHPRIYQPPTPTDLALSQVEALLESPVLRLIHETPDSWPTLKKLIESSKIVGSKIHDARIVAICLGNDIDELWSTDRDFSRIPGLKITNPLVSF